MKKNGFTLVELITTFALTTVIVVLLINVVVVIKNIYSNSNIKTELYIKQSNLSNALNSKFKNENLDSYQDCEEEGYLLCQNFNFVNGESIKLTVTEKEIKFGNFVYNLDNNVKVENPSFDIEFVDINTGNNGNNILVLKIPIICELYPDIDFGINLVYPYI